VAAPIFQKIAQTALRHYGVPQSINAPEPVFVDRSGDTNEQRASGPSAPPKIVPLGGSGGAITVFPDLTGMSARDALRALAHLGMTARLQGISGVVTQQYPPAGEPIESASIVVLKLGRLDPDQIASAANHDRR